jgi:glycosyltransferase involved in cell wall biosynthesis
MYNDNNINMPVEKKAILIINLGGGMGGAQKRNLLLANYILENRTDFYFITNEKLFFNFKNNGLINLQKNYFLLKLDSYSHHKEEIVSNIHKFSSKKINRGKIFSYLGKVKKALRLFFKWLKFIYQFYKIIKNNNIKIIYALWTGGMWVWPLKKILNFKLIYGYNDADLSWLKKNPLDFFDTEYWVLKHCDKIDFLSEGLMNRFERNVFKVDDKRKSYSPCSFVIYDNYYPTYPKKNHIVFLGRLHKDRNPLLILESIKLFQNISPNTKEIFYIIGDGALKNELASYISSEKLHNVIMTGNVYNPWEYLQYSKIFITVANENYPSQSLLEAMACGNAIIASDVGETRKLVTEDNGILVPLSSEIIACAIQFLIENPAECERLGKNARKKVIEEHNIDNYSKYFFEITK